MRRRRRQSSTKKTKIFLTRGDVAVRQGRTQDLRLGGAAPGFRLSTTYKLRHICTSYIGYVRTCI